MLVQIPRERHERGKCVDREPTMSGLGEFIQLPVQVKSHPMKVFYT